MKKVALLAVMTILFSGMFTSCTPEALTNEDESEILLVNPTNDGTIDDEDHRETGD